MVRKKLSNKERRERNARYATRARAIINPPGHAALSPGLTMGMRRAAQLKLNARKRYAKMRRAFALYMSLRQQGIPDDIIWIIMKDAELFD